MAVLPWIHHLLYALLGLMIGSFLNVVIYRVPKILERQWAADCAALNGQPAQERQTFNLLKPGSRCQNCGHAIRWYENVPVVSYLVLRGRCSDCQTPIGLRYPLVEMAVAALFWFCAARWGGSVQTLVWSGFATTLLALALIDWDTTLLPDSITLPLLWAGLMASALGWTVVQPADAIWGAVAGYLSLWLVFWAFKLLTGKEGMGYGDFKLFAALGAWLGWVSLVPVILMASVIGAIVGIALKFSSGLRAGGYLPFGPFLALAGMTVMATEPQFVLRLFRLD